MKRAELIPAHQDIRVVLAGNRDPEPVGVRIVGHDHIGFFLAPKLYGQLKGRRFLGIGKGDGGEFPVRLPLFGHGHHLEAEFSHDSFQQHGAGAMKGGIDDFRRRGGLCHELGTQKSGFDHGHVRIVHGAVEHDQEPRGQRLFLRYGGCGGNPLYPVDNPLVMRRDYLGSVVPIGLVAVVLRRVVAGGDNHAGIRPKGEYSEG